MAAYRSSVVIRQEIKEVEGYIANLNALQGDLTDVKNILSDMGSSLVTAGECIAAVGNVWGQQIDQGKLAANGGIYNSLASRADDIIGRINKAVTELEEQLEKLRDELDAAIEHEENLRRARFIKKNNREVRVPTCFLAGTKVITDEGYKDIDKIKVNDIVLSYNEETRINEYKKVLNLLVHPKEKEVLYTLTIDDKTVEATSEHRFYVISECGNEWVPIKDLKVGDILINSSGNIKVINKITSKKIEETIYNIEVEDNHNYYVTESEILVHNKKVDYSFQNMLY